MEKIKYEYTIYCRQGSAMPYYIHTYKDYFSALQDLRSIVDREEKLERFYFVDNDFFDNKYSQAFANSKYLQLRVRKVTEWVEYHDNIVQLKNY